jgi:hypothetical protein
VAKKSGFILTTVLSVLFSLAANAASTLTQGEIDTLKFMREEEKMARDVYLTMYEAWGIETFANIAESEQKHTDAVKNLLDRYGIEDPVKVDTIGVFVDQELADLYTTLVEQGMSSAEQALRVGALIEEVDMEDIVNAIAETDERMIQRVYGNLLAGSENHLRAFVSQLEMMGIEYEAQILSTEEFEHILDGDDDQDSEQTETDSATESVSSTTRGGGRGRSR